MTAGPAGPRILVPMARTGSTAPAPDAPKKQGRLKQFAQVYKLTAQYDKPAPLWVFGSALLVLLVGVTLTLLLTDGVFSRVLGIVTAVLAAVLVGLAVLTRRADRALFAQVDGRQGATAIVMQQLRRGWTTSEEPVGADPRSGDLVFRAVGKPGIVLLVEGPLPRALRLGENEKKRHSRVASGVPVHVLYVGNGRGPDAAAEGVTADDAPAPIADRSPRSAPWSSGCRRSAACGPRCPRASTRSGPAPTARAMRGR